MLERVVRDFYYDFAYDAIFALAVAGSVQEQNSFKDCFLLAGDKATCFVVIIVNEINKVFERQLGVTNHKLTVLLVKSKTDIEQLSSLLASQHFLLPAEQCLD